jgi:erythromycin esterase-like protein
MTGKVDNARDKMAREIFADWDEGEVKELIRLMRRFARRRDGEVDVSLCGQKGTSG